MDIKNIIKCKKEYKRGLLPNWKYYSMGENTFICEVDNIHYFFNDINDVITLIYKGNEEEVTAFLKGYYYKV